MPVTGESYSTRCNISHRPPYRMAEPVFLRCDVCGALLVQNARREQNCAVPGGTCCGQPLRQLSVDEQPEQTDERMDFVVFGGFEKNAIRITVGGGLHPMNADHHIEWMYLVGYQGGQLKYLPQNKLAAAIFALAEEDAYVYCDRDICRMGREHCQFQCKRGTIAYAYCSVHGLHMLRI